jgi:hypothetical protein
MSDLFNEQEVWLPNKNDRKLSISLQSIGRYEIRKENLRLVIGFITLGTDPKNVIGVLFQ